MGWPRGICIMIGSPFWYVGILSIHITLIFYLFPFVLFLVHMHIWLVCTRFTCIEFIFLFSFLVLVLGKAIQIWAQPLSVLGVSRSHQMGTQLAINSQLFFLRI